MINVLSSKYVMLSSCLSRDNIVRVLQHSTKNTEIYNELDEWLKGINNYTVVNVERYRTLLNDHNKTYFNYSKEYVDNFISFVSSNIIYQTVELSYLANRTGRKAVPLNNANVSEKNLIYTFKSDVFLEYINEEGEIPYYANAFWQFIMLILLTDFMQVLDNKGSVNQKFFYKYISLNILTGLRMSTDFKTDVMYEELFEEISQCVPSNKYNLTKKTNNEKQTITFRIKNNYILVKAFENEGYRKVKKLYDKVLDRKSEGELRIIKGSSPNSIRIILYITGMRTISRILSLNCNPLNKIYLRNFTEKGGILTTNIISFYYRAIVQNCSISFEKSNYTTYNKFINAYEGNRNVALKSAVSILLSKLSNEKRIGLINKYFNKEDYRQKASIYNDLHKLDKLLSNDKKASLKRFNQSLRWLCGW